MRIVWLPADAVCSLPARPECLSSSAVLPVSALACSALMNSTSAAQLSHQIRVSDPHWRMIQTRSRSMVMRVVLLPVISYLVYLTYSVQAAFLRSENRDTVRPAWVPLKNSAERFPLLAPNLGKPVRIQFR